MLKTEHWWERMRGLLGSEHKCRCQGMLIEPCNAIHTLFMSAKLDLLFLDKEYRLLKVVPGLSPWRFSSCRGAHAVLEVESGFLDLSLLAENRQFYWRQGEIQ